MKMTFTCAALFTLNLWATATYADQLVPKDASSLAAAKYVIVGKITSTSFDPQKGTGAMQAAVIAVLKGKLEMKSLKFPVDKNPLSGFDVLLNKGDVAVFFIREVKEGNAHLVAPGASATFPPDYFR